MLPTATIQLTMLPTADLSRLLRFLRDHESDLGYWSKTYSEAAPTHAIALSSAATMISRWGDWLEDQL